MSLPSVLELGLEQAGVQFILENGGGPGVRLRRPSPPATGGGAEA